MCEASMHRGLVINLHSDDSVPTSESEWWAPRSGIDVVVNYDPAAP